MKSAIVYLLMGGLALAGACNKGSKKPPPTPKTTRETTKRPPVRRVSKSGKVTVLLDTTAQKIQSADLEYVAHKRMLVIPTFFHNKVVAYRIR